MTETQPFHFNDFPTTVNNNNNNLDTPSKRGHSHRRSFAISGDFEFLKQPQLSVPPLPRCTSPDPLPVNNNVVTTIPLTEFNQPDTDFGNVLTPRKFANGIASLSPRFFISEEPRFTSPVKGVPDAIINLDDALKTRPKSFKSHRRSESAPADLEVAMDFKSTNAIPNFRIDEEETSDKEEFDSDCENNVNNVPVGLMSPLRPSSPAFKKYENRDPNISPTRAVFHNIQSPYSNGGNTNTPGNNDKFNSLKIKGQKQRYYHYTKQLPTNVVNGIQPQSLKEKNSSTSLTSTVSKTPASIAGTPSNAINTPATPLSSYKDFNNNLNLSANANTNAFPTSSINYGTLYENRRPKSPDFQFHQQQAFQKIPNINNHMSVSKQFMRRNSGPGAHSTFNYESKQYDMPYGSKETNVDYENNNNDNNNINESAVHDDSELRTTLESKKSSDLNLAGSKESREFRNQKPEDITLSMDILMGEPGDTVDLSSVSVQGTEDLVMGLQNFSINSKNNSNSLLQKSNNNSFIDPHDSDLKKSVLSKNNTINPQVQHEIRSASDSIVEMRKNRFVSDSSTSNKSTVDKKKKSKLSIFTNLFSR